MSRSPAESLHFNEPLMTDILSDIRKNIKRLSSTRYSREVAQYKVSLLQELYIKLHEANNIQDVKSVLAEWQNTELKWRYINCKRKVFCKKFYDFNGMRSDVVKTHTGEMMQNIFEKVEKYQSINESSAEQAKRDIQKI